MTASRAKSAPSERDQLMDTKQLSTFLQVPVETVRRWRKQRPMEGPAYVKVGRGVRYRRSVVEEWLDSQTVGAA